MTTQSDQQLITETQQNPKAFESLYKRYYRDVFCFIQKRVNDKETTADITQQVFLEVLKHIGKYSQKELSFSTHLSRIAVKHCELYFQAKGKTRFVIVDDQFSEKLMDQLGTITNRHSKIQTLKYVIQQLSVGEIQLLELRFFERKSFLEGGYIMRISEKLAKLKTYRLLSKMHKLVN